MLEIILTSLLGIAVGIITGLAPGIHVNTVAAFILANTALFGFSNFGLSIFIVSLTVAHSILDFIPSIFVGVPSDDVLSVLPGHKLTKEGRGLEAVKITCLGSIIGCAMLLGLLPLLFYGIPEIYKIVKPAIPLILISILGLMIFNEKKDWWKAVVVIALAGIFGIFALKQGDTVLYSAFTGMFGISSLIFSLDQSSVFPEQKKTKLNLTQKEVFTSSSVSFASSTLLSLIPALGSSQAASVSQMVSKKPESFLLSLGVVNVCVGIISIVSLALIHKARSGAGVAIEKLIGKVTLHETITFVIVGLFVSLLASGVAILIAQSFLNILKKINYRIMTIVIIVFLTGLAYYFDGGRGLFNLGIATGIGWLTIYFGVNRSHGMAFLLIPTLLFFLGFT